MRDLRESCRIAVVQAAPVMFDKAACTVKAVELIRAAAAEQAELIVFPELFIPGYPYGMTFGFTVGSRTAPGRKDWGLYYDNSILVPGPETEILGRAAREARAYVSIGVSERDAVNATLYNTNLIFSPAGELLTVHRKLKPTGAERVVVGRRGPALLPGGADALGSHGQPDLAGRADAPGPGRPVREGDHLYLSPTPTTTRSGRPPLRHIAIEGHCLFRTLVDMVLLLRDDYVPGPGRPTYGRDGRSTVPPGRPDGTYVVRPGPGTDVRGRSVTGTYPVPVPYP